MTTLDKGQKMATKSKAKPTLKDYLTQKELAERLGVSENTLEKWRWKKIGPRFYKLGGVRYKLSDVLEYETEQYEKAGA